ncbi:hypothetical protein ACX0G9_23000 [Flavitalea flava]
MIQLLATSYHKRIAFVLFLLFDLSFVFSPLAYAKSLVHDGSGYYPVSLYERKLRKSPSGFPGIENHHPKTLDNKAPFSVRKKNIGGPNQPEMATFKSVSSDNLVNLFTGDFSYNIPLLDVGGYPVNIFYSGGIGMEQEASWVGLGWNINPGNISRNMRGIPDDFNGSDVLTQKQNMKPNKTWGVSYEGDMENFGIKRLGLTASAGFSFNNYLGPAMEVAIKGGTNRNIMNKVLSEKSADDPPVLNLNGGVGYTANLNSREGLTMSLNISLTAGLFKEESFASMGFSAATSYNSRIGIKSLQIRDQMNFNANNLAMYILSKAMSGKTLYSTSISFARPSYLPAIRMPIDNFAYSGHFQLGPGLGGQYASFEVDAYKQTASINKDRITQLKPMVGYLYAENAVNNPNAVMDFTRFNDKEVTPHTPIISAPQYTYDVFSIQGEGTGGSIRPYRNDLGVVRDNLTTSQDGSASFGLDLGPPGHFGGNGAFVETPSTIGDWREGNKLRIAIPFKAPASASLENVFFRNPGETTVVNTGDLTSIGGTDLVRFQVSGDPHNPVAEPILDRVSQNMDILGTVNVNDYKPANRKKRTQVIDFLTAQEASKIGLDKRIKIYNSQSIWDNTSRKLRYDSIERVSDYRKGHHISQINVTESNGKRYVYGIPVYNSLQRDFTFTVSNSTKNTPPDQEKIGYDPRDKSPIENQSLDGNGGKDGYVQVTETPAYAHSFLLSGLLSPDYVDVTGNGISEDDLGNAVKFNYTTTIQTANKLTQHKWRTPTEAGTANFYAGKRSEIKDDKGIIAYGERESWYLHSLESKTMIAIFLLGNRKDAKGVKDDDGGVEPTDNSSKLLNEIRLYSKADLTKNGFDGAKPIKTVHFVYSYKLCQGTPDNPEGERNAANILEKGKLTLDEIYFTFNGKNTVDNKSRYAFSYVNCDETGNQPYLSNASDRWGTYKNPAQNPVGIKNSDFPYTPQENYGHTTPIKTDLDLNASAWSLKKVLLPSGGQIEVNYESDDYAFVQNKRAMDMMAIAGFGNSPFTYNNRLYNNGGKGSGSENNYLFVKVPEPCVSDLEVFQKYLKDVDQFAIRLAVNMPKGMEMITVYANFDKVSSGPYYGKFDQSTIWIRLAPVNGLSPLSLTALEFLREQLPGQAYESYDIADDAPLEQVASMLRSWRTSLFHPFSDPILTFRGVGKAQMVNLERSFVRLNDPDGTKYGGGSRVKSVILKDNWKAMTGQFGSVYTQNYDYTTTEFFNGKERTISSGVASYEPAIGAEENPFHTIEQVADKLPLGPTSYGSVEMPVLDAFFPAPLVGYSKVTVTSVPNTKLNSQQQKSRSGIGRQVTVFVTAKDFPVFVSQTKLDPTVDKQAHDASTQDFFYKYAFDSRALSQGFLVEVNDMHGKLKSQTSYAENDPKQIVNYTENFYRNTGSKGLGEMFDFVSASRGGIITPGNMGIDIELMTDTREFSVKSSSFELQVNVDEIIPIPPFWLLFPWPVEGNSENTYRAVTTTKVINYHSIVDCVVVMDKGSVVSTKNLVFDEETGDVIVSRTNNEFNKPIYNTAYPAWWAYSGMGPAYKNSGVIYTGINFYDGRVTNLPLANDVFESGDELFVTDNGNDNTSCIKGSDEVSKIWVFDKNKNNTSLTVPSKDLVFMDENGNLFTRNLVGFRIVRSGKRNMLDARVAGVVSMVSPILTSGSTKKLFIDNTCDVINGNAAEFKEKWATDRENVGTFKKIPDPLDACSTIEVIDCNGYLKKNINPYVYGLLGNFRAYRSQVFYDTRAEFDPLVATNLSKNGFLNNFKLYWDFNGFNNLVPDFANTKWTWNSQITKVNAKGLEVETVDPLGIYTSAQYGFSKTMPVAVANNAGSAEMFYEGFEDYTYTNGFTAIDSAACPNKKHIDFNGLPGAGLFDAGATPDSAHTGKYSLKVSPGSSQTVKSFLVKTPVQDDFTVNLESFTPKVLSDPGGVLEQISATPHDYLVAPDINFYNFGVDNWMFLFDTCIYDGRANPCFHNYNAQTIQYTEVTQTGTYNFELKYDFHCDPPFANQYNIDLLVYVMDGNGRLITTFDVGTYANLKQKIFPIYLCKGFYSFRTVMVNNYAGSTMHPSSCTKLEFYSFLHDGPAPLITYKSYSTSDGCPRTLPAPATEKMLNPVFTVPADKEMIFSAWVRESCSSGGSGTPCNSVAYTNSKIKAQFLNSGGQVIQQVEYDVNGYPVSPAPSLAEIVFAPVGPVINGWQRIQGYFKAPQNAAKMNLTFVNAGNLSNYFDDIRIHPFNSNMKSYVFDPFTLRLTAELDANNYASFYEYDEEGTLIRTKAETRQGIKTIKETRSAKQMNIMVPQCN